MQSDLGIRWLPEKSHGSNMIYNNIETLGSTSPGSHTFFPRTHPDLVAALNPLLEVRAETAQGIQCSTGDAGWSCLKEAQKESSQSLHCSMTSVWPSN